MWLCALNCVVSCQPKPSLRRRHSANCALPPRNPLVTVDNDIAWIQTCDLQAIGCTLHSTRSAFTGCTTQEMRMQGHRCAAENAGSQVCCGECRVTGVLRRMLGHRCAVENAGSQVCCGECRVTGVLWRMQGHRCAVENAGSQVCCGECWVTGVLRRMLGHRCAVENAGSQVCCGECWVTGVLWRMLGHRCDVENAGSQVCCGECRVTDIAIGAPFDGDGKVYIYHGSASGINIKPAQVLDGEGVGVKRFGYSLSGGMDIDGNSYPDLVVGSLSDSVVLYRARPVIHVLREISVQPQNIDLEQKNCRGRDGVCVEVKVCFIYTAQPKTYNPRITLSVMFEADSERRKLGLPHRVNFLGRKSSEPEYQRSEEVELRGQHARACQSTIFQLQDSLRDKLSPISVSASYSIKQARHSNQPTNKLGAMSPVLNAAMPSTLRTEVNFLREGCGEDKICQSNLQLSHRFGTRGTNTDLFTPLPVDMEGMPVFSLSDQKTVALEVTVTNLPSDPKQPQKDGDDAHAAQLLVGMPETLSYSGFRGPQDKQLVCAANANGSYAECELGNPMKRNGKVTFYIILSTSAITIETTDLAVNLQLLTISEQPDLLPIVAEQES
ncbi:integrin alpha-7-like [Polyodon spathula]|uniref:integrin alpha-7-like n=1 Tax=Polyodon spathula TaxID=7913 RepID=UPI001B7EC63C|nr:integrin alpha-7-like [Polyodon spathula]